MSAGPEDLRARRQELGRSLRSERIRAGLLQRELARKIGYSRSAVGNAEAGHSSYARRFWELCDEVLGTGERSRAAITRSAGGG
jgi:transcriptional regulator with XRE-family HTH domain